MVLVWLLVFLNGAAVFGGAFRAADWVSELAECRPWWLVRFSHRPGWGLLVEGAGGAGPATFIPVKGLGVYV